MTAGAYLCLSTASLTLRPAIAAIRPLHLLVRPDPDLPQLGFESARDMHPFAPKPAAARPSSATPVRWRETTPGLGPRPPSSASVRPSSRASARPASRASTRASLRPPARFAAQYDALVAGVTGLDPAEPDIAAEFAAARAEVAHRLEHGIDAGMTLSMSDVERRVRG
jgi:hypothetical protein